jgi:uncharacterized protein DUF6781
VNEIVDETAADKKGIGDDVRRAIERGRDIQQTVRDITLKALARGELDLEGMRRVTREAVKGVQSAAAAHGEAGRAKEALAGVDEALAHAAQALSLSIREAAGRAAEFSREDLVKTREDLKNLERLFLDTLHEAARGGRGVASAIIDDAVRHAQASGTAVGDQLTRGVGEVTGRIADAGKARFESGMNAALASGATMARIAAGVLAGIADALGERSKPGSRPERS